jgi:hypothetical protein
MPTTGEAKCVPTGRSLGELMGAVMAELTGHGIEAKISKDPYEFQRGGNGMLVLPAS